MIHQPVKEVNTPLPARSAFYTLKRYWWVALITFGSAMGATVLYLKVAPQVYETSVRLNVEDGNASISELGQTLTQPQELGGADPIVTQAELVKSQGVLQQALDTYAKIEPTSGSADLPSIEALQRAIQVKILPATSILEMTYISSQPQQAAVILNEIAKTAVAENTRVIRQEASAARVFLEGQIPALKQKLAQAEKAESQYRQVNGLVSEDIQNQEMVRALVELQQEERTLTAALKETATRNQSLKQITGINSISKGYTTVNIAQDTQLQDIQSQLTETELAIAAAKARLGDQHPDLLALLDQQKDLQRLYEQRLSRLSGLSQNNAPTATSELSQTLITQLINSNVDQDALKDRLSVVRSKVATLQTQLAQQPILAQPLADLIRQRQEAETSLNLLQTKLEEARIAEAQAVSNIRVLGKAEAPEQPIAPKPLAVLAIGVLSGSLLAAGSLLLINMLDGTLQSGREAEALAQVPLLSELGKLPTHRINLSQLEAILANPRWMEPYRALLTTLEVASNLKLRAKMLKANGKPPPPPRLAERPPLGQQTPVIAISSIAQADGKSTVTFCLGAVAAMLGKRTLLIAADPDSGLASYARLASQPGLSDVISGQCSALAGIQQTAQPKLAVLPYGQPLNAAFLLTQANTLGKVLQQLAPQYDLILLDAPPVSSSVEAATLSRVASHVTDGLVLVIRPGVTSRNALLDSIQNLRKLGACLLGMATNQTVSPPQTGQGASRQRGVGMGRTLPREL